VDTPRTYSSLLFSLYRTLGNILARQRTELQRIQPLLTKRERTDVQTNPDQYMTRDERAALDEYFVQRERLSALAQRVDESVFVLRDLAKHGFADDDPYVPIDPIFKS
jgi:DNA-directed RNA polymerase III subunit RPC3